MLKKHDLALYEALMERKLISRDAMEPFIKQVETSDSSLLQMLVKEGLFGEKDLLKVLADKMKLSCVDLRGVPIDKQALDKIPVKIALYYKFIPLSVKDRTVTIAVSSPLDIKTEDEIRAQLGYDIEVVLACENDILEGLRKNYGVGAETLGKIISQTPAKAPGETAGVEQKSAERVDDITKLAEDASVIKLVNQIILEAYRKRATDIHVEPFRQGVSLRYRIDGILYDANAPADMKNFVNAIISRIKIMSNLNIVERRLPQDGRAIVRVQDKVLDLRISTIPTPFGESVVIRILPTQMLFSLEKLGLSKDYLKLFEKICLKPHGIIFVTGPTGSGKTTTLYTCLARINTKERKIITIEDPIEYEMSGIIQIQVMPDIGLDFARGLRSILRHDPDVIMVGEVRDLETAEIAIRVALTGHLVFSTIHTNDAASGITRLIDIGVEPYLIASSVEAFVAQRLVRLICPDCRHEDKDAPPEVKETIAREMGMRLVEVKIFKGKGCPNCNHTGFFGRTAIYEILLMDEAIKELVVKKTTSGTIKKAALAKGMRTLRQDGWLKVTSGATTPEEIMNVALSEDEGADAGKKLAPSRSTQPEDAASGLNRRAYFRLNEKVNIRCKLFKTREELLKKEHASERLSITKNISAAGILFISSEPMPIGALLELTIELPDGNKPIECLAKVVRAEEVREDKNYDIAACFLDMTGAQKARMDSYVESGLEV